MLLRLTAVTLACAVLSGCVQNYADRDVAQGAVPGSLVVMNAPQDATVFVDGRPYRAVDVQSVALTPGRHEVVIEAGGRRIHSQSIFVAPGARLEVRVP